MMMKIIVIIIFLMLFSATIVTIAEYIKTQDSIKEISNENYLIAHWEFNENNGNILYDSSGNGFHGTVYGDSKWTNGKIDGALEFKSMGEYISITENKTTLFSTLSQLGQGSISVWFRVDYIPASHGIAPIFYYGSLDPCDDFFDAANQGLIIEVGHSPVHSGSKRLYFTIWANGCTYPSFCFDSRDSLTEGEWYHFVAVVGPDYNTGFLNGEEMVNRRYNFGNSHYSQFFEDALVDEALWFGRGYWDARSDPSHEYFDGAIDDIRIFSKPLSSEEIWSIYKEGSNNIPPNKPSISGPVIGIVGETYEYTISTVDPDGDDVYYWIEWFDGCPDVVWEGLYESGEEIKVHYKWREQGTFTILIRAKDSNGSISDTATHRVTMPKILLVSNYFQFIFDFLR